MTSDVLTNSAWSDHSGTDIGAARAEAERRQHELERLRAARVIAAAARDPEDARDLLGMLGLEVDEMKAARSQRTVAA
jgi:hypothetical protein